ncbi:Pentatricopeptide repeat-containing protein [Rhynchospora pubera]|uniref:Pentatricopeptide repeat-containing protein n=1 Tax=Rhynchospora pubera TaxID=906938 RepID=A0AAV8E9F6_9POAL|nr:Pentatricopeptide repeat-containing protein [Rhynchospora pubera]
MHYSLGQPKSKDFTSLLKLCSAKSDLKTGRQIHAQLFVHGFASHVVAMTAVVNMYAKCNRMEDARKVFDGMPDKDLVSWNAMVSGYVHNCMPEMALQMVRRIGENEWIPDSVTLVSALPACTNLRALQIGTSIHGFSIRHGFDSLVNISAALVDMYAKCGEVSKARLVFDRMPSGNVVSWNSMIDGYRQNGNYEEALELYKMLLREGIEPDEVTFMGALHACGELGNLNEGKQIHKLAVKLGFGSNLLVMNALITIYCKCKGVDLACEVFKTLPYKTLVSWNAMILGYAQNGYPQKAITLFLDLQRDKNVKSNSFTIVSVIPALADLSSLRQAKVTHACCIRHGFDSNIYVLTGLIDLYSKCGSVILARVLFDLTGDKNVATWNAMIDGYGSHGLGKAAIKLFEKMKRGPLRPNDVTFLSVLSACSHTGLLEEGWKYFHSMEKEYGLEPKIGHYGSMVHLLGRVGELHEAWNFIQDMPIEPSIAIYGALLGACKVHKDINLAERVANKIFELRPDNGGYHVLLANIYADASMWDDMARVRKIMDRDGLLKIPGWTFIELRNEIHTFYSGDTTHPQAKQIYSRLDWLIEEIKKIGYIPDTKSIDDVEEKVNEKLVSSHSEKLAIAFGLISSAPGTTIQIRKNLRVCIDCHNATKFISKLTGREIIVRDMQRFHYFREGSCSCGDYCNFVVDTRQLIMLSSKTRAINISTKNKLKKI